MAFSTVADPGPSDIQPWVRQILPLPRHRRLSRRRRGS